MTYHKDQLIGKLLFRLQAGLETQVTTILLESILIFIKNFLVRYYEQM